MGNMNGYKARAHKQFAAWRKTWADGTGSEDKEPVYPYGHMLKYLIEPDHTVFLDLLGGGGFTPHGHGNKIIGTAMGKMVNQAYQTSDRGDHVYSATAEFMNKVEEYLKFDSHNWRLASSETEAFLLLMEALTTKYDAVLVVNGPERWPATSQFRTWNNLHDLSPGNLLWKQISRSDSIGIVVYPVNPETFRVVDHRTLSLIDSIKSQKDVGLIWDLSVTAGWTREPFDVSPSADGVILGGSLGGGLPFGAVVTKEPLPFPESGRWSATAGNALTAQLGLHSMMQDEGDKARDRYDELAAAVGREVETLQTQLPEVVREVTGGGMMVGLVLNSVAQAEKVVYGLRDRGVLVGTLGIQRGVVPFIVNRMTDPHDVSELFDKIFEILTEEDNQT